MIQEEATVFIVDDDESLRTAIKRLVQAVGYHVKTFDSAPAFLDYPEPDTLQCLILDIRMPGMSGMELQEQLADAGRRIPIIFITGHGTIPMSVKAIKSGAVDFIEKPFDDQKLIDAINQALKKGQRHRLKQSEMADLKRRTDTLTPREYEVFELVVNGRLNKQIAFDLGMSEKTVKVHRARVMQKMEAGSLAELVKMSEKLS